MARPSAPTRNESGRPDFLISPEADKALSRIVIGHFIAFAVLLLLMTVVGTFFNDQGLPMFRYRHILTFITILIVMIPFFLGTNKFFKARLQFGRDFVDKKQWKEAVASLEAFNHVGQRFLDPTGEAHYLLSLALAKEGRLLDADKVKAYVLQSHPSSAWAEQIRKAEVAKPKAAKAQEKPAAPAEQKLRQAPKGRKRRF